MGDAGVFWNAAAFNMDVAAFTSRQMDNVVDDQAASGSFPIVAPQPAYNGTTGVSQYGRMEELFYHGRLGVITAIPSLLSKLGRDESLPSIRVGTQS